MSSPVTIGFLKPIILLPVAALNSLTPQQVEAVLLHELSHIRRYDYLINLVITLVHTLFYFNPFIKKFVSAIESGGPLRASGASSLLTDWVTEQVVKQAVPSD